MTETNDWEVRDADIVRHARRHPARRSVRGNVQRASLLTEQHRLGGRIRAGGGARVHAAAEAARRP